MLTVKPIAKTIATQYNKSNPGDPLSQKPYPVKQAT